MGKHAYLIMAHGLVNQLCKLILALDHERNDIYIHFDRKSNMDLDRIRGLKTRSAIKFVDRINVAWGGVSIVKAELILLRAAVENGPYDFYHLLSGQDFPLKKQSEILSFFDNHKELQFISCKKLVRGRDDSYLNRVKYWYPFQDSAARNGIKGSCTRKVGKIVQKALRINRLKKDVTYGIGSQFFDITDDFARYVLDKQDFIEEVFKDTFCSDEIFLQTLYLNSPFFQNDEFRFRSTEPEHRYIQRTYFDVKRAIDWNRGEPYIWRIIDLDILLESNCFFARKFDERVDNEVIDYLFDLVVAT